MEADQHLAEKMHGSDSGDFTQGQKHRISSRSTPKHHRRESDFGEIDLRDSLFCFFFFERGWSGLL